jgi:SPP1 gp7 family putative phage head morphogenesis protein
VTVNSDYTDALLRHQIGLLRYSGGIRKKINALLDATEDEIAGAILKKLDTNTGLNMKKLNDLMKVVQNSRAMAMKDVIKLWEKELKALVNEEAAIQSGITAVVAPVVTTAVLPSPELLAALVAETPIQGKTLREWGKGLSNADIARIKQQIMMGMVLGEDSRQIARRVVGTQRTKGADGATQLTRRQADAITRTAIMTMAGAARRAFFLANPDLFDRERYVATLDARTTPLCRSLDGNVYAVATGPYPPLHMNCRSIRIPFFGPDVFGDRPFKAGTEKQLLREYAKKKGIPVVKSREDLPYGTKTDFDKFARKAMNDLTGQVPAETTYAQWLKKQPVWFQEDVLGKTRAKLFRGGGLDLPKFVNTQGDEIPLKQLAVKHRNAFKAAGLDPENYI